MAVDGDQNVLNAVRRTYDELTHSQKRIAEAIVEDPEFVAFATVDKLAERISVAPSTVVRFAYKIGLNGYPDLQERVRQVIRGQIRGNSPADVNDATVTSHLEPDQASSLDQDVDNLRRTIIGLDAGVLTNAAKILGEARHVFVVGGYASGAVAAYTALTLERVRGQAYLIENYGGRHIPALFQSGPEDAVLAIGFAPYSSTTVQVIEVARERGAQLIGITDTPISPVGQRVDIVIPTRVAGVGAQNSLVAPLAVVNLLINATTSVVPDSVQRYDTVMRSMHAGGLFVLSGGDTSDQTG